MKRKLTVILAADLVGYSRLVSADEEQCIERLKHVWDEIFDVEIKSTDGRIIKRMGDGLLAEFQSPVSAVRCAIKIQESLSKLHSNLKEEKMEFRIGINLGDVVEDGEDLLGDGVNVASRLEAIAQPGSIYVSKSVHDHLGGKIAADLMYLGPHQLKNIPEPVDVWQVKSSSEIVVPGKAVKTETNPSLAILPFEEIGPAQEDFFADGIVEEITGALSRVREFSVIARQSSYSIKRENTDVREVGRILGAGYIVTGSVRRSGDRVRISVQLSNTQDGTQIWTERFDDHLEDVFELQDRIANSVAGAISPTVRASEIASAKSKSPDDRGAYSLVMSAYPHFWSHRKEENNRAIELLTMAIDRNPDEAHAKAMRAWCNAQQAAYLWADKPLIARDMAFTDAAEAELKAGNHVPTLVAIGAAFGIATTDQERATAIIERALSIDPNSAWGWMRMGWSKSYMGDVETALSCFDKAQMLSPKDPFLFNLQFGRAFAYGIQGEYEKAISLTKDGLRAGPGVTWAYRDLASYLANAKRIDEADEAVQELLKFYPDLTIRRVMDGMPPSVLSTNIPFFEGLRRAGVPES